MTTIKTWGILFGLQVLVVLAVFSGFLTGQFHFAYIDIGSDSYTQVLPDAMHMARKLASEGFTGWSFELGLGGPTALLVGDTFSLIGMLGGPDQVLHLRIWVYLLKIVLGGAFFLLLVRCFVTRWETALISSLAYSFCGFVVINGQWDLEATEFVFFPLILWAIVRTLRTGSVVALPLVLAAALASSVFFVSVGAAAFIVTAGEPREMFKTWLVKLLPLVLLGYLLSAPRLLPIVMQILDSSRVSGGDALFEKVARESLSVNSWEIILAQIGGLFHKDIFGVGSNYKGYWNYLEGPEFFIGITLLMMIPQVWSGTHKDKKVLLTGIAMVVAYILFPVFRNLAMGFGVSYFRVSTLWISIVLLLLAAKAVDQIIINSVNIRLLFIGMVTSLFCLLLVMHGGLGSSVAKLHVFKVLGLVVLACAVLVLAHQKVIGSRLLPFALLAIVAVEATWMARPSYLEGRGIVTPALHASAYNDETLDALKAIRANDQGVFRIEKTFDSVSLNDALAQNYMGIKSYFFHSKGVVDFFVGTGLISPSSAGQSVNYTNWLPNAKARYMLNSFLGVKYIISKQPLNWTGFVEVSRGATLSIYRNDLALPFGVVQSKQITKETLSNPSFIGRLDPMAVLDVAIINAAIVEKVVPGYGSAMSLNDLAKLMAASHGEQYFAPATRLQTNGLKIETFSSNHVAGNVNADQSGILVFSIPFSSGWTLKIDGHAVPLMRGNFGFLAAPILPGRHKVTLDFVLPGQNLGLTLGGTGLLLLGLSICMPLLRKRKATRAL
jgi:uncharacterized membrane protein YfhO